MATSKDYMEFVIDQSGLGDDIATGKMMGEYLLYYKGKHIGGICDNRLLVKKTKTNEQFGMPEAIPYTGAKPMFLVNVDNRDEVKNVIIVTSEGVKLK